MLSRPLPSNVDLLSLEPWDDHGRVLIRLEHIYEVDEDPVNSQPVTLSFKVNNSKYLRIIKYIYIFLNFTGSFCCIRYR